MKGIILAGGTGSRLYPLTKVINKHLLPIYNKPMIFYPIETLCKAGITDILIVLGGESTGELFQLLGSGKKFGANFTYKYQDEAGGIAHALSLAEDFANGEKVIVLLGDNIIQEDLKIAVKDFEKSKVKAGVFLKQVSEPERFGVAEVQNQKIIQIVEKPENPKSNWIVTGIYMYHHEVFDIIKTLKPSDRGELEITDINNSFILQNALKAYYLEGFWTDAGIFESLFNATVLARESYLKRRSEG
ncbi:MAG: NTP transferase domain-containing protein [Halanaerobiales bacterium]|nr:NTP transferase domain-containing protein [Halanaerobiales bacterium]